MWSCESLYQKSSLYFRQGLDQEDHSDSKTALFLFLGLELLGRSALSNINKALLADPKDGFSILFACGFPGSKSPISIPVKTVFHRCTVTFPSFTTKEYDQCMIWMNYRNEELHTGSMALQGIKPAEWMPNLFRIATIFLIEIQKTMEDLIGSDYAEMASLMITERVDEIKKEVFQLVAQTKKVFLEQEVKERLEKITESENLFQKDYINRLHGKKGKCPACEGTCLIKSELIRSLPPQDKEGTLIQHDLRIPVDLKCYSCKLAITGNNRLQILGLGEQYTEIDELDPKDYYGIEFDPAEYYEEDYGND